MTAKILPLLPLCHTYVEPFAGSAAILFAKKSSPVEVYNDIDGGLVNFFRIIANPKDFEQFYHQVALLPYARSLYYESRNTWKDIIDPIERAVAWFVVARQSFSGILGSSWSNSITFSRRGMSGSVSSWLSCIEGLPEIHQRFQRVQIEQVDWQDIFKRYDTPETLFYCDPPYVHNVRTSDGGEYKHEMTNDDHKNFISVLLKIQGMAIVSGYEHEIYKPLENNGWVMHKFHTACYAACKTKASGIQGKGSAIKKSPRTEILWCSPRKQKGKDYDERDIF